MNNNPELRAAMKCRVQLRKNMIDILSNVRPDAISDYLYQERALDCDQLRRLTDDRVEELERTRLLFDTLYKMQLGLLPTAFNHFVNALQNDVDWLAVQITFTNVTDEEINSEWQQFERFYRLPSTDQSDAEDSADSKAVSQQYAVANEQPAIDVGYYSAPLNDTLTTTYAASVLMYRFVRNVLTNYATRRSQAGLVAASRQPGIDAAAIRNVTFGALVNDFFDDAQAVGFGERQAAVDVRRIANALIRLGDEFERTHGRDIDEIIDQAEAGGMGESTRWFTQLASVVLAGEISWGRIVSLFVFSSRFVLRLAMKGLASITRLLGTAVFGFTKIIGRFVSPWISQLGGWVQIDNPAVAASLRNTLNEDRQRETYFKIACAVYVIGVLYSLYRNR